MFRAQFDTRVRRFSKQPLRLMQSEKCIRYPVGREDRSEPYIQVPRRGLL